MEEIGRRAEFDALLLPFLQAAEEKAEQSHLHSLLHDHAAPTIRAILGRRLGFSNRRAGGQGQSRDERDAEDIFGETQAQLLRKLHACKAEPTAEPIRDFRAYVAVLTYHACDQYLRQKYPRRWSLKNRLTYLLTHQPGFALWEDKTGEWLCGFAVWKEEQKTCAQDGRYRQLCADPQACRRSLLPQQDLSQGNQAELLAVLFNWVGQPFVFNALIRIVAELCDIKDRPEQTAADAEGEADPSERVIDTRVDIASEVGRRLFLQQLWTEISQLPPRQCAALLLNLRDARGRGIIALLPLLGIATLHQIAAALAIPLDRLAAVWNDLPLEDATIAEQLGITRQQVINLRKVARERLGRRMREFGEM